MSRCPSEDEPIEHIHYSIFPADWACQKELEKIPFYNWGIKNMFRRIKNEYFSMSQYFCSQYINSGFFIMIFLFLFWLGLLILLGTYLVEFLVLAFFFFLTCFFYFGARGNT